MYNKRKIKDKIFRRVVLLGSFKLLIFSCIIGRLYKLQVVDRKKYKTLSNNNRINLVIHAPIRGKILDSTGNIIADNRKVYTLTVTPFLINNIHLTIKSVKNLINISLEEINLFYSKLKGFEKSEVTIALKEYLSWSELSIISVNTPNLPGIDIKVNSIREYSRGSYYAHILGYTSKLSRKDSKKSYTYNIKEFDLNDNLDYLLNYNWPGNVRELRNLIERIAILSPNNDKTLNIIKESLKPSEQEIFSINDTLSIPLKEARESFEKEYLTTQLKKFSGNISKTAKFVGMERSALHRKLKLVAVKDLN